MTRTIALNHPVDVGGIAIRFVPVRPLTPADIAAAQRAARRRWTVEDRAVLDRIAPHAAGANREREIAQAFLGCVIVGAITGLPLAAAAQLDPVDQAKIAAFLDNTPKA